MSALAPLLEGYFRDHLGARRASVHTVSSYRDSFRLLVTYAAGELRKAPVELELADLDTELIGAFLDHLEHDRHVSVRTRNSRLGAIRSLYTYASYRCSEDLGVIRRVLAIPAKAREHTLVTFLEDAEVAALIETPDQATRLGRRDHALLVVGIETGLRVSELTGLRFTDVSFGRGANVYTLGKGRRERITPLRPTTAKLLEAWQGETPIREGRASVPGEDRRPAQHRRRQGSARQARQRGERALPLPFGQDRDAAHAAPHLRDAPSPLRSGPRIHRVMAGTCEHQVDGDLLPRRPATEGRRAASDGAHASRPAPLPAQRRAARLPRGAVTMPGPERWLPRRKGLEQRHPA